MQDDEVRNPFLLNTRILLGTFHLRSCQDALEEQMNFAVLLMKTQHQIPYVLFVPS